MEIIIYITANVLSLPIIYWLMETILSENDHIMKLYAYVVLLLVLLMFNLIAYVFNNLRKIR